MFKDHLIPTRSLGEEAAKSVGIFNYTCVVVIVTRRPRCVVIMSPITTTVKAKPEVQLREGSDNVEVKFTLLRGAARLFYADGTNINCDIERKLKFTVTVFNRV